MNIRASTHQYGRFLSWFLDLTLLAWLFRDD